MSDFNKETSAGRIAAEIVEKRQSKIDNMQKVLADDFVVYFNKHKEFPSVENDNDIMAFIIARPELRSAFGTLDLNRDATVKLFKEAIELAEEKIKNEETIGE